MAKPPAPSSCLPNPSWRRLVEKIEDWVFKGREGLILLYILRQFTRFIILNRSLPVMSTASSSSIRYTIRQQWNGFDASDANVLYHETPWVITTPNAHHIPRLFHWEDEDVQAHADGRFGYIDLFQWPQMIDVQYPWSVTVPRPSIYTSTQPLHWAFFTPKYEDFAPIPNSNLAVGFLVQDKLAKLQILFNFALKRNRQFNQKLPHLDANASRGASSMQSTRLCFNHLQRFPLTWHNLVASVAESQRSTLECYTIMDYFEHVQPHVLKPTLPYPDVNQFWIGGFTTEHHITDKMFAAGVPVWLVRRNELVPPTSITVRHFENKAEQPSVMLSHFVDPQNRFAKPFPLRWRGPGGTAQQVKVREYNFIQDLETFQDTHESEAGPAKSCGDKRGGQSKPYQQSSRKVAATDANPAGREHNKWVDTDVSKMPPRIESWSSALSCARHDNTMLKDPRMPSGYRFPEPALFAHVLSADSLKQYLANWVVLHPFWLGQVTSNPVGQSPGPKLWCAFLNSSPGDAAPGPSTEGLTRSAAEKVAAWEMFGGSLSNNITGATWAGDDGVDISFRGMFTRVANLGEPSLPFIHALLWELSELHFHYDLLTLDRFINAAM
ncbi:hypothetical protein HYDPIDRAFT_33457 [Hydnomerulius pinastri MD-312]|uniref:Uncharacterized protein n=1 Tax=Hydnomerulius pinastri MD-312 TaxID=994086 RepID=A0A0C9W8X3_9AGAM|nr:hypothetical protein HYDPIDRAFT_33457 [Hydnomerulius pinastri MD-312]